MEKAAEEEEAAGPPSRTGSPRRRRPQLGPASRGERRDGGTWGDEGGGTGSGAPRGEIREDGARARGEARGAGVTCPGNGPSRIGSGLRVPIRSGNHAPAEAAPCAERAGRRSPPPPRGARAAVGSGTGRRADADPDGRPSGREPCPARRERGPLLPAVAAAQIGASLARPCALPAAPPAAPGRGTWEVEENGKRAPGNPSSV